MPNFPVTIYTHLRPDLDACASVWAARTYIPGAKESQLRFVPANWNGRGRGRKPDDLLLDISSGMKGEKDESGKLHSCFALLMKRYAPPEERAALRDLIDLIDAMDSTGNAYKTLAPELTPEHARAFSWTGLGAVLSALAVAPGADDRSVVSAMCLILDGFRSRALAYQQKCAMANNPNIVKRYTAQTGEVVCLVTGAQGMNSVLFEQGAHIRFVIYTSESGREYGVNRNDLAPSLDIHNSFVQAVLTKAQEAGQWFVHPNGFLLAWGTSKSPAEAPSRVRPEDLAQAYVDYLDSMAKTDAST